LAQSDVSLPLSEFLSHVSMQCMQSVVLLWQILVFVCMTNDGIVSKRIDISPRF